MNAISNDLLELKVYMERADVLATDVEEDFFNRDYKAYKDDVRYLEMSYNEHSIKMNMLSEMVTSALDKLLEIEKKMDAMEV